MNPIIILLVTILITTTLIYTHQSKTLCKTLPSNVLEDFNGCNRSTALVDKATETVAMLDSYLSSIGLYREVDEKVDKDTLTQPIQRYPTNYYPTAPLVSISNIPTRGLPDTFSFLGNLYREYDNKIIKLYGRRRYNDVWDYYAVLNAEDGLQTKINIPTKNNREIFDGDMIEISMFQNNGPFKAFLNKKDEFAYSPYLF